MTRQEFISKLALLDDQEFNNLVQIYQGGKKITPTTTIRSIVNSAISPNSLERSDPNYNVDIADSYYTAKTPMIMNDAQIAEYVRKYNNWEDEDINYLISKLKSTQFDPMALLYCMATESSFNPNAKSSKSSARGLGQLTLDTLKTLFGQDQADTIMNEYNQGIRSTKNSIDDAFKYYKHIGENLVGYQPNKGYGRLKVNMLAPSKSLDDLVSQVIFDNSLSDKQKEILGTQAGNLTYKQLMDYYDQEFMNNMGTYISPETKALFEKEGGILKMNKGNKFEYRARWYKNHPEVIEYINQIADIYGINPVLLADRMAHEGAIDRNISYKEYVDNNNEVLNNFPGYIKESEKSLEQQKQHQTLTDKEIQCIKSNLEETKEQLENAENLYKYFINPSKNKSFLDSRYTGFGAFGLDTAASRIQSGNVSLLNNEQWEDSWELNEKQQKVHAANGLTNRDNIGIQAALLKAMRDAASVDNPEVDDDTLDRMAMIYYNRGEEGARNYLKEHLNNFGYNFNPAIVEIFKRERPKPLDLTGISKVEAPPFEENIVKVPNINPTLNNSTMNFQEQYPDLGKKLHIQLENAPKNIIIRKSGGSLIDQLKSQLGDSEIIDLLQSFGIDDIMQGGLKNTKSMAISITIEGDSEDQNKKVPELKKIEIGNQQYLVEVVTSEEDMALGLGKRDSLDKDKGMLFDFGEVQYEVTFNMEECHFPLDIIFIDDDNEVIRIANGCPDSLDLYTEKNVRYVLEVNPKSGVKIGDELDLDPDSSDTPTMKVLAPDGSTQMELQGGERIFSRKNTKTLIKMAKRAEVSKSDVDYKKLGNKMFKYIHTQDTNTPEYVEVPEN